MDVDADISVAGVKEAVKLLSEREAGHLLQRVEFVTIEFPPGYDTLVEGIAYDLLKTGLGIRLRASEQFAGSGSWAVQTERHRVVNKGL